MKNRVEVILLGLLAMVTVAQTTVAADGPLPTTSSADVWVERAEKEAAVAQVDVPDALFIARPLDLALYLYRFAPTEKGRELVIRLVEPAVNWQIKRDRTDEQARGAYAYAALVFAIVNDASDARQMLARANSNLGLGPTTNPMARAMVSIAETFQAETYLRLGDNGGFERFKLDDVPSSIMVRNLRDDGLQKEAALVANRVIERLRAEATTQPADQFADSPGRLKVHIVEWKIELGDLRGAALEAAHVEDNLPPDKLDGLLDGSYICDAYLKLARACAKSGDRRGFDAARDAIVATIQKHPKHLDYTLSDLLNLCLGLDDKAGFAAVAPIWQAQLRQHPTGVWDIARLAIQFEAAGDHINYQSEMADAETFLAKNPSRRQSKDVDAKQKAQGYLWIAAARARAGDLDGVARAVESSRQTATLGPSDWDEVWWHVVYSYAEAGRFTETVTAMAQTRDDPHRLLACYLSRRQALAGRFDDAWQSLTPVPEFQRIMAEYALLVIQVQAGHLEGLETRIAAMKTANERALADIAVAGALIGKPYVGYLRIFEPRDDWRPAAPSLRAYVPSCLCACRDIISLDIISLSILLTTRYPT